MATSDWEEAKDRVRDAADIVQVIGEHVQLRRAGGHFTGLCPFHSEKTPSFSVNPQRQMYKCFGCGESGDVFAFLMKYQNLSFSEALKELASRCQISLPEPKLNAAEQEQRQQREMLLDINANAACLCHEFLINAPQAEAARQYLARRGVPQEFIEKYQLGYAPESWDFITSRLTGKFPAEEVERAGLIARKKSGGWYDRFRGRVMFPIPDHRGRVCAFGGRVRGDEQPKYMNSPESPIFKKGHVLFGLHQHREAIRAAKKAVIVEGNFDLLMLDVHGIANTVAPLGTALTKEHLHALRGLCSEVVLLFDGDQAGLRAAKRAVPICLAEQMEVKVALLPAGHDPDSLVRGQGKAAVEQLINSAQPLAEFVFDALAQEHGLTLTGKSRIAAELAELVKQAADRTQRELMAAHFAAKLGVAPNIFGGGRAQAAENNRPAEPMPATNIEPQSPTLPGKQRQLLNFLIFYPEFFNDLRAAGLEEHASTCAAPVRETVAAMVRLADAGSFAPEQLLAELPDGAARQLVTVLLTQGAEARPEDGAVMEDCANLVNWLRSVKKQEAGANLLQQLMQAQQETDSFSIGEKLLMVRRERLAQKESENCSPKVMTPRINS